MTHLTFFDLALLAGAYLGLVGLIVAVVVLTVNFVRMLEGK